MPKRFLGHKKQGQHGREVSLRLELSVASFAAAFNNTEDNTWMGRGNMKDVCRMLRDVKKSVEHDRARLGGQNTRQPMVHAALEPLRRVDG